MLGVRTKKFAHIHVNDEERPSYACT